MMMRRLFYGCFAGILSIPIVAWAGIIFSGPVEYQPLHDAIVSKNYSQMMQLLNDHPEWLSEARDPEGKNPLMLVAQTNDIQAMELLIQAGADVNAVDWRGITALMYAVGHNRDQDRRQIFQGLFQAGAKVNIEDSYGDTAMDIAYLNEDSEAIKALTKAGAYESRYRPRVD